MADFYSNPKIHSDGLNYFAAHCNKMATLFTYTLGDSWATVNAAILDSVTLVSGDFAITAVGNDSKLSVAPKTSNGAIASEVSSAVALLDTTLQEILYVAPETSLVSITIGTPVNYPTLEITVHNVTA